jgi:hypothetical protein
MRRNHPALFFFGAVYVSRDDLAVPVHQLRGVGVIEEIDSGRNPLVQADGGPGNGAIVSNRANGVVLGDVCQNRTDVQRNIGWTRDFRIRTAARTEALAAAQKESTTRQRPNEPTARLPGSVHYLSSFPVYAASIIPA